ncbi:MAG TPA: hypothetical protein VHA56_20425 [Mucilaginibacter sp.]|nr:hypothetical protein [Mucilaginibacter sp.]
MSQVKEIKCPHCGKWTLWEGRIDDRCLYCDGFLETRQFSYEVEQRARRQAMREDDYFFVRPGDGLLKRWGKRILNTLRWWTIFMQVAFFVIVTIIIVLISLIPG